MQCRVWRGCEAREAGASAHSSQGCGVGRHQRKRCVNWADTAAIYVLGWGGRVTVGSQRRWSARPRRYTGRWAFERNFVIHVLIPIILYRLRYRPIGNGSSSMA